MSITFINDHPFYVDDEKNVYTSGTLSADVWNRFTDNFGNLTVIGRGIHLDDEKHSHKLSSNKNVKFDLFFDIQGGIDYYKKRKDIITKLKPYILNSDYIVLRLPSNIGVLAADLCKKHNKKYFVEVVGCAFDSMWYFGNLQGKILAPYTAYINKKAIKKADAVVYVTKEYLQDRYPSTSPQINASNVVIEGFSDEVLKAHLNKLTLTDSFKFGMIGNISLPYKGYEVLFKALSSINIDFTLSIVGGGDNKWINELIKKYSLENNIKLIGRINEKQKIYEFLDSLDLYLQPSLTEGLPRSVIEAMSRACPIIASNAGGIPELINNDYIYTVKDHKKLSQLILSATKNKEELKKMSIENFKNSRNYEFEIINDKRYQFFKNIRLQILNK